MQGALCEVTPAGVRSGSRAITAGALERLLPAERMAIDGAIARRRHEFASGRALLRELMGVDEPITVGPAREPVAPAGWRCTLAHDAEVVVAAATDDPRWVALGIDVELVGSVRPDEAPVVRRADEIDLDPTLVFVVKEAVYKAWSTCGGWMVDHHEVRITATGGRFDAMVVGRHRIGGRYARADDRWVALAAVDASGTVRL